MHGITWKVGGEKKKILIEGGKKIKFWIGQEKKREGYFFIWKEKYEIRGKIY